MEDDEEEEQLTSTPMHQASKDPGSMIPSAAIQHPWPYAVQGGITKTNRDTLYNEYKLGVNCTIINYYTHFIITLIHVNIQLVIQQWTNLNIAISSK